MIGCIPDFNCGGFSKEQFISAEITAGLAAATYVRDGLIEEPANLKLLIVVSKLLTGFDAPSCTGGDRGL